MTMHGKAARVTGVSFLLCRSGATAIEYALIAAAISVVIVGAVAATGDGVLNLFTTVANAMP